MTDRELLEAAARAAGINLDLTLRPDGKPLGCSERGLAIDDVPGWWNPFTDDGAALRLAVTLGLVIACSRPSAGEPYEQHAIWRDELCDTATLTRRAIVRAAAEIGRSKT
jgi:hypothetical protein